MEYLVIVIALIATIINLFGQPWDDTKKGRFKFTRIGIGAIVVAVLICIISVVLTSRSNRDQQALIATQKAALEQSEAIRRSQEGHIVVSKEQLAMSQGLANRLEEQLGISQRLVAKQEEQLSVSQRLTDDLEDQLSLLNDLAGSQKRQTQISEGLTAQQRQQIRRLVEMRFDRDLIGVEVSFTPSPQHWAEIAYACNEIPPISKDFPYSAATITAERTGGYWDVDFSEIVNEKIGSQRPWPVSTQSSEGKAFEKVIEAALAELSIEWGEGSGLTTVVSRRGDYPTSVTISKNMITFTFRPPKLRLNLSDLRDNSTVKLRGRLQYPTELRFRSLDNKVRFNEWVKLNWERKEGNTHTERWLPLVSEGHRLNIDWSRLVR